MYRRFLILVVLVLLVAGGAGGTLYALSRGASEAKPSDRLAASVPARIAPAPSSQAGAAAPTLVNFQGILEDSQGTPISGSVQVTFSIHDAATGGMVLFEETQTVSVQGGLFSVLLGSTGGPIGLDSAVFTTSERWLGIKVGADPEMTPRLRIASVPYSLVAAEAELALDAAELSCSACVVTDELASAAVTGPKLAAGSVGSANIISGAVTAVKLASNWVDSSKVVDGSVQAADLANGSVVTAKLAANAVDSSKVADGSLQAADLANGSVATARLAANSVDSSKVVDGSVQAADLAFNFAGSASKGGKATDADKLDGLDSSAFARAAQAPGGVDSAFVTALMTTLLSPFTVTILDSGDTGGYSSSMAIGLDGLPIIAYHEPSTLDLRVAHCRNVACTSAAIITADSTGNVGLSSSIGIGGDLKPVISYLDATNGSLKVVHCGNSSCIAGNTISTVDNAGGSHTSIAFRRIGTPVISYSANGALKVVRCSNFDCASSNTITTVDDSGTHTSIALGADNVPVISYASNSGLKVAHCGDDACGGNTILTTVDGTVVGGDTSIAIGRDELPVISYHDVTNKNLRVAHCGNASCSSGNTITTVDAGSKVGEFNYIAIGPDGLPIISYHDDASRDLKVARCLTVTCSASTITTLDRLGNVGRFTSIVVGSDGLPVISYTYHELGGGLLKVLHCARTDCTVP